MVRKIILLLIEIYFNHYRFLLPTMNEEKFDVTCKDTRKQKGKVGNARNVITN